MLYRVFFVFFALVSLLSTNSSATECTLDNIKNDICLKTPDNCVSLDQSTTAFIDSETLFIVENNTCWKSDLSGISKIRKYKNTVLVLKTGFKGSESIGYPGSQAYLVDKDHHIANISWEGRGDNAFVNDVEVIGGSILAISGTDILIYKGSIDQEIKYNYFITYGGMDFINCNHYVFREAGGNVVGFTKFSNYNKLYNGSLYSEVYPKAFKKNKEGKVEIIWN